MRLSCFVTILLAIINYFNVSAQRAISVEYKEWYAQPQYISNGTPIYKLIIYPTYSVYYKSDFIRKKLSFFSDNSPKDKIKNVDNLLVKFYKEKKILYLSAKTIQGHVVVLDSLHSIKWTLVKAKPIRYLGLDCFQAKGHFRGRNYTAFFAPKISVPDGPFKFSGLPGLILKISSDDYYKIFQAIKINYHVKELITIPDIFRGKTIPFHSYVRLQKITDRKFIENDKANHPLKPGETREVYLDYLEKTFEIE